MLRSSLLRQPKVCCRRSIFCSSVLRTNGSEPPQNLVQQRIKDWSARTAVAFRTQVDDFSEATKVHLGRLGAGLNRVTGYEEIEILKRQVQQQEARIAESREAARQAKLAYHQAVSQRSESQRQVNELLQRKSQQLWTEADAISFGAAVREDHFCQQEEIRTKNAVEETDAAVEREFSELLRMILARYHEEQVWSDKIRSASTYGQLAVLGLNLLVFVVAILVVEPWKRRRLAQTFEEKVELLEAETRRLVEGNAVKLEQQLAGQTALLIGQQQNQPPADPPAAAAEIPWLGDQRALGFLAGTAFAGVLWFTSRCFRQ